MLRSVKTRTQPDDWLLRAVLTLPSASRRNSPVMDNLSSRIIRLFAQLTCDQRAIITLRHFEKMNFRTIANVMNCSRLRAYTEFRAAQADLRRHLVQTGFSRRALTAAIDFFQTVTCCDQNQLPLGPAS